MQTGPAARLGVADDPELVEHLADDDLLPAIREGLSYEGKLYAAPFYAESSMLMYRKDLADIPANVTDGLKIVPVRWIDEVLDLALERPLRPVAGKAGTRGGRSGGRRQRPVEDQTGVKH